MKIQSSLYYLGLSCFPVCILSLFNIFYSYYFDYLLDVNSYIIVFSIISDVKNLDPPLIIWRSSSQWLGGFYFLVFLVLIFSNKNFNFKMIDYGFNFEKKTDFAKNILNVSYRIFFIYLTLTLIIFLLFILSDVRIFNSLNLSMTIISSGGFLPTNTLNDILKTNLHHIVLILGFLISIFNFYILYNLFFGRNNLKDHGEDLYILLLVS